MKKVKRIAAIVALIILSQNAELLAQDKKKEKKDPLNTHMEVTRNYEPIVLKASKLSILPNMMDTMQLRPNFNYSISPRPVIQHFKVKPIQAASVNLLVNRSYFPSYVKIGIGAPLQSILEYNFSNVKQNSMLSTYFKHYGQYNKIENDAKIEAPAFQTNNQIGILGETKLGRFVMDGGFEYAYDNYTRYGYYVNKADAPITAFDTTRKGLSQYFNTLSGQISFGDRFKDLSYLNFRIYVDASYYQDRFNTGTTNFTGGVELEQIFAGNHDVYANIQYDNVIGYGMLSKKDTKIMTFTPQYRFNANHFLFMLGFSNAYDFSQSVNYFFPRVNLSTSFWEGIVVPYIDINGRVYSSDYKSNPYLAQGVYMPTTSEYNGYVGICGKIADLIEYDLFGGVTASEDMAFYVNKYNPAAGIYGNTFDYITGDVKDWNAGIRGSMRLFSSLYFNGMIRFSDYKMEKLSQVGAKVRKEAALGVEYRDQKLLLGANVHLLGGRWYYQENEQDGAIVLGTRRVNGTVDVSCKAEYRVTNKLGVFVNVNNITNAKLIEFNHYNQMGINGNAGIRLSF